MENFLARIWRDRTRRLGLYEVLKPYEGTRGMSACSAGAGDYEDPDRTAWANDEKGNDERETENEDGTQAEVKVEGEEFPAES